MRRLSSSATVALLLFAVQTAPGRSQDEPLGKTAAFGLLDAGPSITVPAGTALRSRPSPDSARLATVTEQTELQILDRQGDWVRTAYLDWTGWLAPGGEEGIEIPVPADLRTSHLTIDTRIVELAEKLHSARRLLGPMNPEFASVGRWQLHTDVHDRKLLELLDRVARQLPALYAQRFGLIPPPPPEDPATIVLFAREEQYRVFATENTDIGELAGGGHADTMMAVLFVGEDSSAKDIAAVLAHELTHLLNREHFPEAPATWLEEGMANELGFTGLDAKGNLRLGRLGGTSMTRAHRTSSGRTFFNLSQSGGRAAWTQLVRDWRNRRSKLTPLDRLLDLPWEEFVDGGQRASNYALSVFFIRYLLDQAAEETTMAFRRFLAAAADGAASDGAALARALDTTPEALRRDFEHWLTVETVSGR